MNDFTKEELVYLKDGIAMPERCEMNNLLKKKIEDLWVKISKMIDNCDTKIIEVWHCEKCGHVQRMGR